MNQSIALIKFGMLVEKVLRGDYKFWTDFSTILSNWKMVRISANFGKDSWQTNLMISETNTNTKGLQTSFCS